MLLHVVVALQVHAISLAERLRTHVRRGDRGQSTAEYALVLLGAAGVALLFITWATKTDTVNRLLNSVMNRVLSQVS
jgi:hypothetical protein